MDRDHWPCVPLALSHKVLQTSNFLFLSTRHLFDVFAGGIIQQAMLIGQTFLYLLPSLKGRDGQFYTFLQYVQKQFDIFLTQVTVGRRAGFNLNSARLKLGFTTLLFGSIQR
jgi:hypothetical protein